MKHVIAFATIGACLLVLSGGAALAADPGQPNQSTLGTGQPGGVNGAQCGTITGPSAPPGQAAGTPNGNSSPFPLGLGSAKKYAGSGVGGSNPKAFSNYDVACFQAP
jgi:hypothetical protein